MCLQGIEMPDIATQWGQVNHVTQTCMKNQSIQEYTGVWRDGGNSGHIIATKNQYQPKCGKYRRGRYTHIETYLLRPPIRPPSQEQATQTELVVFAKALHGSNDTYDPQRPELHPTLIPVQGSTHHKRVKLVRKLKKLFDTPLAPAHQQTFGIVNEFLEATRSFAEK